jgi:hypothetical protein
MKKEIEMRFEKTIKNTYKYLEISDGIPVVGILYITRTVFETKRPKIIKVTVECYMISQVCVSSKRLWYEYLFPKNLRKISKSYAACLG